MSAPRRPSSVLATLLVAAIGIAACGGGSDDDASVTAVPDTATSETAPPPTDPPVTDPPATDPPATDPPTSDEPVGTEPPATMPTPPVTCGEKVELGEYAVVDCDEPHDSELVSLLPPPQQNAPRDEADFEATLARFCLPDVASYTGKDLSVVTVEIGFVSPTPLGESFEDPVECWVTMTAERSLVGSIAEVGLDAALGDATFLSSLEPGDCYSMVDEQLDSFDIVRLDPCDAEGVEQVVAFVTLESRAYPGQDGLVDEAFALCDAAVADTTVDMISSTVAVVYPDEIGWTVAEQRGAACVAYIDTGDAEPVCAIQIPSEGHDPVDCAEPHDSEFAGFVTPPDSDLPTDPIEAEILVTELCAPTVSEYLGGRDLSTSGVGVGFDANTGLGEPFGDDINCWVVVGSPGALDAAIAEVGLEAAMGEHRIIAELDPGTCFTFAPDTYDLGFVVDCTTPDALMAVGLVSVDDDGPWPGDDPLRAIRFDLCSAVLAETSLSVDPASVSGTFPNEIGWEALGRRYISCDAVPA
jgi:Septum formation